MYNTRCYIRINLQLDTRSSGRREIGLQKSVSQQLISLRSQSQPLSSSKSTTSLIKPEDSTRKKEEHVIESEEIVHEKENEPDIAFERNKSVPNIPEKIDKQDGENKERAKSEGPPKIPEKQPLALVNGPPVPDSLK